MNKLISTINEILHEEYKNTDLNPEIKYACGFSNSENKKFKTYHANVYLKFTKDGKRIMYPLVRVSHTDNNLEDMLEYLDRVFYKTFINNLLFSTGPLRIAEILSNGELEPSLIMDTK